MLICSKIFVPYDLCQTRSASSNNPCTSCRMESEKKGSPASHDRIVSKISECDPQHAVVHSVGLFGLILKGHCFSFANDPVKHLQHKRREPSPKRNLSLAQPPLPPGPERNPGCASFDKPRYDAKRGSESTKNNGLFINISCLLQIPSQGAFLEGQSANLSVKAARKTPLPRSQCCRRVTRSAYDQHFSTINFYQC